MTLSRRLFIQAGLATGATAAFGAPAAKPILGLVAPPADYPIPPEGLTLYDPVVTFKVHGLGLKTMTPQGYDSVIDQIVPAAMKQAKEGANAIVIFGTSLTFYRGSKFNNRLVEDVRKATGLKTTSMSTAVVDGLKSMGGRRIAVATAYADEVNGLLMRFLREHGFDVLALKGLGFEKIGEAGKVSQTELQAFCAGVFKSAPKADALLVSCGGLRTLELLAPLEKQTGVPVVSSTPHALWAGVRLTGLDGKVAGYGKLIAKG